MSAPLAIRNKELVSATLEQSRRELAIWQKVTEAWQAAVYTRTRTATLEQIRQMLEEIKYVDRAFNWNSEEWRKMVAEWGTLSRFLAAEEHNRSNVPETETHS